MQTDHEKGAVGHLAGKFDHAGPGRQQIDRRRCRAPVPQAGRRWAELDVLSGKELADIANRFAHDSHPCALLSDAPRRNEPRRHREAGAPRCNLLQAMGKRSENERMANQRARGGGEQTQALRRPARQRQVSVPAARRMIMDSDAVEACLLAADDERGEVKQRSPNGDSEIDADPGHLTKAPLFSIPTIRSFRRNENRAKRFLRRDASGRARHWPACRRVRFHGEFAIGSTWKEKNAYVFAASAAFTRSGVIGYWRSLPPVASKNALAIAAAVAPMTSSPAPVEGSSRRCTTTAVTCGCSAKRSTG